MEGYDVVTTDDSKVGKVVAVEGDFLIIESGHVLKSRHPVPMEFAHVDDAEELVRITVPKEVLHEAPKVEDALDEHEAAKFYGLTEIFTEPDEGERARPVDVETERVGVRKRQAADRGVDRPALLGEGGAAEEPKPRG